MFRMPVKFSTPHWSTKNLGEIARSKMELLPNVTHTNLYHNPCEYQIGPCAKCPNTITFTIKSTYYGPTSIISTTTQSSIHTHTKTISTAKSSFVNISTTYPTKNGKTNILLNANLLPPGILVCVLGFVCFCILWKRRDASSTNFEQFLHYQCSILFRNFSFYFTRIKVIYFKKEWVVWFFFMTTFQHQCFVIIPGKV